MSKETNLVVITNNSPPRDAEAVVTCLESCGGNLKTFLAMCPDLDMKEEGEDEIIIAGLEHWLSKLQDKAYQRRWNDSIKRNMALRLRLLQNSALERLEALAKAKDWVSASKENTGLKLVLASVLAGETHLAKQKQAAIEEQDDTDDADADAAMSF